MNHCVKLAIISETVKAATHTGELVGN